MPIRVPFAIRPPAVAAVAGSAAVLATLALTGTAQAATADVWDRVAQCESGGDWSVSTGNGFYGGLQFTPSTWAEYGGTQYAPSADQAGRDQQIAVAEKVLAAQGPQAWPICSLEAGLGQPSSTASAVDGPALDADTQSANGVGSGPLVDSQDVTQAEANTPTQAPAPISQPAPAGAAAPASGVRAVPPVQAQITTAYRQSGAMWASGYHTGVDFQVPTGTPVQAIEAGDVVAAGDGGAYGNQVVIHHADGTYSQYAHMAQLEVGQGQHVEAGAEIGLSGSTGNSSGPHLHFEVRTGPDYGSDIDPLAYLRTLGITI